MISSYCFISLSRTSSIHGESIQFTNNCFNLSFIKLRKFPSILCLMWLFTMIERWFHQKLLLNLLVITNHIGELVPYFIILCYITWFLDVKPSLHFINESPLARVCHFSFSLDFARFRLLIIFENIFASMFVRNIGLKFSLLVMSLFGFGIRGILASKNKLRNIPSSSIFW